MKFLLTSFHTCPYVQRSVITLKHKQVPFEIQYIDLANPPAWFTEKSPLGKVPMLEVTDEKGDAHVLFESAVINEFVNEVTPGNLLPEDPIARARARAWIEFASNVNMAYYLAATAKNQADYEAKLPEINDLLNKFAKQVQGPYFLGKEFSLVDTSIAPVLQRLKSFETFAPGYELPGSIRAYADRLLALDSVKESIVEDWESRNNAVLKNMQSYALTAA